MSNLKVEGKISDWCPKCKNCKGATRESNGVHNWLTEVECVDPYDGMVKILDADSDICCSMFEPKPACEKCERFDGTYCHSPEGIFVTSYMATGNCSFYSEKKEKEPFNLNMPREALEAKILDLFEEKNRLNGIINGLEKEKAAHMKGIERLKKSQEKLQNIVTEKEVEIKGLRKDITALNYNRTVVKDIMKKNAEFNQTISDQEVAIKALIITIKEMCKEDETNA